MGCENLCLLRFRSEQSALISPFGVALAEFIADQGFAEEIDGEETNLGSLPAGVVDLQARNVGSFARDQILKIARENRCSILFHVEDSESDSGAFITFYDAKSKADKTFDAHRGYVEAVIRYSELVTKSKAQILKEYALPEDLRA